MVELATSRNRAQQQTERAVNERIHERALASVTWHAAHPGAIDRRLAELDREWDIERWLQANSAALSLLGLAVAATGRRRWLGLPALVQGFFLQHALQGWCPPLPIMRRLGIRTPAEIDAERHALKALRGDYEQAADGEHALEAVQRGDARGDDPRHGVDFPASTERVPQNSSVRVNERLRRETQQRLGLYAAQPELRESRLHQLAREWDVERAIETEGPVMTFTGMLLALVGGRRWLVLPIFSQAMMLVHALIGAYPLLPFFRRMGFRTRREIGTERYAIKALRGDFAGGDFARSGDGAAEPGDPAARAQWAFEAARRE